MNYLLNGFPTFSSMSLFIASFSLIISFIILISLERDNFKSLYSINNRDIIKAIMKIGLKYVKIVKTKLGASINNFSFISTSSPRITQEGRNAK